MQNIHPRHNLDRDLVRYREHFTEPLKQAEARAAITDAHERTLRRLSRECEENDAKMQIIRSLQGRMSVLVVLAVIGYGSALALGLELAVKVGGGR